MGYGNGGWVRVDSGWLPGPVYLRFAEDGDGRWRAREMYLDGDARPIEAADLRRMPLAAIETIVQSGGGGEALKAHSRLPAPDLSTLASYYSTTFGDVQNWVADSFRAQLPGGADLRVSRQEHTSTGPRSDVPPLAAPEEGLTDEFLRHVAAAYVAAVENGLSPAPELARQSGRPVRTVHRWIYIGRQRGFLPPAGRR